MSADLLVSSGQGGSARRACEQGRINVRGITLKEYFRLCGQEEQLREIKEESAHSSKSSLLQTPSFHPQQQQEYPKLIRFRTQVSDTADDLQPIFPIELPASNRTPPLKFLSKEGPLMHPRRKVLTKVPSVKQTQVQGMKRSTLGCFYQMGEKQRRMLRKVQADRERAEDMVLREAICITKYGRMMEHSKN